MSGIQTEAFSPNASLSEFLTCEIGLIFLPLPRTLWKHINNCETDAVVQSTPEKPRRKLAILWADTIQTVVSEYGWGQTLPSGKGEEIMNFFSFCDHVPSCVLSEAGKNSMRSFN